MIFSLFSVAEPFEAWIVVSVFDKQDKAVRYEQISFDWLKTKWKAEPHNVLYGILVDSLPDESFRYVSYIWNQRKVPFTIKNTRLSIHEVLK